MFSIPCPCLLFLFKCYLDLIRFLEQLGWICWDKVTGGCPWTSSVNRIQTKYSLYTHACFLLYYQVMKGLRQENTGFHYFKIICSWLVDHSTNVWGIVLPIAHRQWAFEMRDNLIVRINQQENQIGIEWPFRVLSLSSLLQTMIVKPFKYLCVMLEVSGIADCIANDVSD